MQNLNIKSLVESILQNNKISVQYLAKHIAVSRQTIYRILDGKQASEKTVRKIIRFYCVVLHDKR